MQNEQALETNVFVNTCYNVTEPQVEKKLKRDDLAFKCYMGDTGLLISHAFDEKLIQG